MERINNDNHNQEYYNVEEAAAAAAGASASASAAGRQQQQHYGVAPTPTEPLFVGDGADGPGDNEKENVGVMQYAWYELMGRAVVPFAYYDLRDSSQRKEYCDLMVDAPVGEFSSWVPYLVGAILVDVNMNAALWAACAVAGYLVAIDYYHSTYRPLYPQFYWLNVGEFVAYLGLGAVSTYSSSARGQPLQEELVEAMIDTSILVALLVSIAVRVPFTVQYAKPQVPPQIASKKIFLRLHLILSGFWAFLFVIKASASWVLYVLHEEHENSAASDFYFGAVVPVLILIFGIAMMPVLAKRVCNEEDILAAGTGLYSLDRGRIRR